MMFLASCLITLALCLGAEGTQAADKVLSQARDVLSLSEERANTRIPVEIEGVVTVAQPDWGGRFFVQDATAGIFVENVDERIPLPGDLVRIKGYSHPGGFAPIITEPEWEKIGTAPLPAAKPIQMEDFMEGYEDSQRIKISSTVRSIRKDEFAQVLHLTSGGYRFQAILPSGAIKEPDRLIGARVSLQGTAVATYKGELRQMIRMELFVPTATDVKVEKLDLRDPFLESPVAINQLAKYRSSEVHGKRVRVRGTVTHQRTDKNFFISDGTGGLHIRTQQAFNLSPGEMVEAVGFLDYDFFLPVLEDAVISKTGQASQTLLPNPVTIEVLRESYHHADLVSLQGKVVDISRQSKSGIDGEIETERVTLLVQTPTYVFTALGPANESNDELAMLPLGSIIELEGICLLDLNEFGVIQAVQILLTRSESVRILEQPSWITPRRLLLGLAILSVILLLAFVWIVTVSRKNSTLKTVVRDKVEAQVELEEANDLLEQRVEERTNQLKFEVNERQAAEVRFKATLAERTRLAQELHDTTEQSLAGISLQLDTASKLYQEDPAAALPPLKLAKNLMRRSHAELRQSIWDLRSRELEEFNLAGAMELSARETLQGTEVQVTLKTSGQVCPLPEVVEENLLRISREAVNNVIKHAEASKVELGLNFKRDAVILVITDNGRGFSPDQAMGAKEGHFGLLGMSERAKRLRGTLEITSSRGRGTQIEIKIPLDSS